MYVTAPTANCGAMRYWWWRPSPIWSGNTDITAQQCKTASACQCNRYDRGSMTCGIIVSTQLNQLCITETPPTKSSVIPSPITSLASQTTSTEKQAPTSTQRRSDALLEQLTLPLRNPVSATVQSQPIPGSMPPGSKESSDNTKDGNASQQVAVDKKVCELGKAY